MTAPSETARAWVDVDLDALVANAGTLVAVCGTRLLPMVKANGYGLGATRVARALEALDPWGYGGGGLRATGGARTKARSCGRHLRSKARWRRAAERSSRCP